MPKKWSYAADTSTKKSGRQTLQCPCCPSLFLWFIDYQQSTKLSVKKPYNKLLSRQSSLDDANGVFDFNTVLDIECKEINNFEEDSDSYSDDNSYDTDCEIIIFQRGDSTQEN